ncbi:MAG: hypothetical protein L0Z62_25325 [Gemmataceae bacterium]|nr:hypothetical protein [Gemmataceae bacterium]
MTADDDFEEDPDWVTAVCEREEIAELLEAVIREYLDDAGIPPVNDRYEWTLSDQAIGRYPSRPQMRFFLEDLAAFTPELINRIRKRVLSQFKQWTVVPQFHDQELTIAPSGVWFGKDGPAGRKVRGQIKADTPEYQKWLRKVRRLDSQWYGTLRRQLRHVEPLIPAAIPVVREKQAAVLAVFAPADAEGKSVAWVLTRGGNDPLRFQRGQTFRCHTVAADGTIEPLFCGKYWPTTDVPSPFFLLVHALPGKGRAGLTLVAPSSGKKAGKVLGKVAVGEPIRDADRNRRGRA